MLTSLDEWEGRAERIGAAVKELETAVKAGSSNLTLPLLKEQVCALGKELNLPELKAK
ncbi:MAG: hypothetical protein H7301_11805 [Cryobacterium sp.]|nr:hypothetical protein [Oligoflexia bacterium]